MSIYASYLLAACAPQREDVTPYSKITTQQTMNWLLDPYADVIWDSAGSVVTAHGIEDLAPKDDKQWDAVGNAAASIVEAGNLLMMPHHLRNEDAWIAYVQNLKITGGQLLQAAQRKDAQAIFDLGGQLYINCQSCHDHYLSQQEED